MTEHKAFLFDSNSFENDLRPVLERALLSGDPTGLVGFIIRNLKKLRDPYEGQPLGLEWESMIETKDSHQYGDFALTKYYDPTADIGIGLEWESIQDVISKDPLLIESPILGATVGSHLDPFDPGKLGSYFQSVSQVQKNYIYLCSMAGKDERHRLGLAIDMLKKAADAQTGLYVTF